MVECWRIAIDVDGTGILKCTVHIVNDGIRADAPIRPPIHRSIVGGRVTDDAVMVNQHWAAAIDADSTPVGQGRVIADNVVGDG